MAGTKCDSSLINGTEDDKQMYMLERNRMIAILLLVCLLFSSSASAIASTTNDALIPEEDVLALHFPQPYVNSLLENDAALTVFGNEKGFPKGTIITLRDSGEQKACPKTFVLTTTDGNGKTKAIKGKVKGSCVVYTVPKDAVSFEIGTKDRNHLKTIQILYPFAASEPIPFYGFYKEDGQSVYGETDYIKDIRKNLQAYGGYAAIGGTLIHHFEPNQCVLIACGADAFEVMHDLTDQPGFASMVRIDKDYQYDASSPDGSPTFYYDETFYESFLQPWLKYQEQYETHTFCAETGGNNGSNAEYIKQMLETIFQTQKRLGLNGVSGLAIDGYNGGLFDDHLDGGDYQMIGSMQCAVDQLAIVQKYMSTFQIEAIPLQAYTGRPCEPMLTVLYEGKLLAEGTDYQVCYVNNTEVGHGSAVVVGCNGTRYEGISTCAAFDISDIFQE